MVWNVKKLMPMGIFTDNVGSEKAKMLFHVSMKKPRYLKKQRNARFSTTAAMSHRLRMRISAVRPMASPKP